MKIIPFFIIFIIIIIIMIRKNLSIYSLEPKSNILQLFKTP